MYASLHTLHTSPAARPVQKLQDYSSFLWDTDPLITHVTETQDDADPAHMKAADAHFDRLSKAKQAKARKQGYRPYRELPAGGDYVMPLDEAKACWRLQQSGNDAVPTMDRQSTYTRDEMLSCIATVLGTLTKSHCAYMRGQTEIMRIGLGIGSEHSIPAIARMLGLSAASSVHEQIKRFRARWQKGLAKASIRPT